MFRPAQLVPAAIASAASLLGAACGGNATSTAGQSSGTSSPTAAPATKAVTDITVAGGSSGPNGALTGASAACVDEGQAGLQVAIQGSLSGSAYVLKFNAPNGQTDISTPTTQDIEVLFARLPAGSNWRGRLRRTGDGLSESQVRDAHAEGLGKSAAVEDAGQRVTSLPRFYGAHRGSHLMGQPCLRPLARIRRVRLPLRAKLQKLALPQSRGRLAILHHTARYCQYGWQPASTKPPRCRVVSSLRQEVAT